LVSLTKVPDNTSTESLFSSISDNLSVVWFYNSSDSSDHWKMYAPGLPQGAYDLVNLDEKTGFWLKTDADVELLVEGSDVSGGNIPLYTGWNMIGYPTSTTKLINDSLDDISSDLTVVWAYNSSDSSDHWKMYAPGLPQGAYDLEYMSSNLGYWFKMDSNTSLNITW